MVLRYFLFLTVLAILAILAKGQKKKYFCEIISRLSYWPRRKCCLKNFFSIFSSGCHLVQQRGNILSNSGKGP